MSIEAIEAIERHIHQRENGLPFSEIIRLCEEFVAKRDKNEAFNSCRRYRKDNFHQWKTFAIREGREIERVKV